MTPDLVAHCDQVRAERGLPDEILFRLLDDMAHALVKARGWTPNTRRHVGIPEELIA